MIRSISRNFPAAGSEGLATGIQVLNTAMCRKLPFGDNWQQLRIGILCNVETFGITRSGAQPCNGLFIGVCSGPWSIGDPLGRTWRSIGVNVLSAPSGASGAYDYSSSWTSNVVGSTTNWRNTANERGGFYYVYAAKGSYATGGISTTRSFGTPNAQAASGQFGFPDTLSTPRRTAVMVDLYRSPYGTAWNFKTAGVVFNNANQAFDLPVKSYLMSLGYIINGSADPWYGLCLPTVTASPTATTATTMDTRNSPLDHLDFYWDSLTMALEIWRMDVIKLA